MQRGRPVHQNDVAAALDDAAGTNIESRVRHLLDVVDTPDALDRIAPFARSVDAKTRFRAQEAAERLQALAAGTTADPRPRSQQLRAQLEAGVRAWEANVHERTWVEVPRAEVLAAVRGARLVLFGEGHAGPGPLRDAQCEVLRAMADDRPEQLVLGFEPSVEVVQRTVIDCARELGVAARATEAEWQDLVAASRLAERDDQTAQAIAACLAESPDRRMLVIRGEGHLAPDGYMLRQLRERPVLILSTLWPPWRVVGDRLQLRGRTFRIGAGRDCYFWAVEDLTQGTPALTDWLTGRH